MRVGFLSLRPRSNLLGSSQIGSLLDCRRHLDLDVLRLLGFEGEDRLDIGSRCISSLKRGEVACQLGLDGIGESFFIGHFDHVQKHCVFSWRVAV